MYCPISNQKLSVVLQLRNHPIPKIWGSSITLSKMSREYKAKQNAGWLPFLIKCVYVHWAEVQMDLWAG